jgi:hypothetical protein
MASRSGASLGGYLRQTARSRLCGSGSTLVKATRAKAVASDSAPPDRVLHLGERVGANLEAGANLDDAGSGPGHRVSSEKPSALIELR